MPTFPAILLPLRQTTLACVSHRLALSTCPSENCGWHAPSARDYSTQATRAPCTRRGLDNAASDLSFLGAGGAGGRRKDGARCL